MKNKPLIGGHVSTAGGVINSIQNAQRIGAQAMQIFVSSSRQWKVTRPSTDQVKEYKKALKESNISAVFIHAPYLNNLASGNAEVRKKSLENLTTTFQVAQDLGVNGVVVHTGSSGKDETKETGIDRLAEGLKKVFDRVPGKSKLAIENSSGGGWKIGVTPHELGEVFRKVNSPRLAMCLDTAHAFESAMTDYTPQSIEETFNELDKEIGKNKIIIIHANDSKTVYGSHHDRHDNIGEGHIGLEKFKNLAAEKRVQKISWILETPGFSGEGPDEKNIKLLHSLFD